jgi:hypothetical protein
MEKIEIAKEAGKVHQEQAGIPPEGKIEVMTYAQFIAQGKKLVQESLIVEDDDVEDTDGSDDSDDSDDENCGCDD